MQLQPEHVGESASACRGALEPFVAQDWAVRAGDLTWDVRRTVTHVCDAVGWYAAHLARQSPGRLRFDFLAHGAASNAELLDVLDAAAATLAQVARAAPAGARAFHTDGMADTCGFLAWGATRSSSTAGTRSAVSAATSLRRRISPSGCLEGSFPGPLPTRPRGEPCCGRTGVPIFPVGSSGRARTGPGIVRRSTSGMAPSRAGMRTHRPDTNGTGRPVGGVHAGDAEPRMWCEHNALDPVGPRARRARVQ